MYLSITSYLCEAVLSLSLSLSLSYTHPYFNLTHHVRYLELQIHGEIRFDRDIDMLVVHKDEVNKDISKWLQIFSERFGCKVCVFNKGIMRPF